MIKKYLQYAVAAALGVMAGISNVAAFEVERDTPNDSIATAQRLIIGAERRVEVKGIIGNLAGDIVPDIDFYSFHGQAENSIRIDIDDGIKCNGCGRSLNAMIAIFDPNGRLLLQKNDMPSSRDVDAGSIAKFDPHLEQVLLPVSGIYTVAVTSDNPGGSAVRVFKDDGVMATPFVTSTVSNGSYLLVIEGVSPSMLPISIDIKPGATTAAPFNPKSKGKIPVALISANNFNALQVDRDSVRFGPPNEGGAAGRCGKEGEDVNGDGRLDLVCHFETQETGIDGTDTEGVVSGTVGGMPFEGRGWLKIVPVRKD
jgi:hypothetical protein